MWRLSGRWTRLKPLQSSNPRAAGCQVDPAWAVPEYTATGSRTTENNNASRRMALLPAGRHAVVPPGSARNLHLQQDRDGTVVDELELHLGPEPAGGHVGAQRAEL